MYLVDFPFSGRNLGRRMEQPAASEHQIGEAKQREQLSGVLGQSPVARLANDGIGSSPRGRDARPWRECWPWYARSCLTVHPVLFWATPCVFPVALRHARLRAAPVFFTFLDALVTRITKGIGFVTVQECLGLGDVMHIGGLYR